MEGLTEVSMYKLAENLIKLMDEKGVTYKEVARSTHISKRRMKRFINGDVGRMKFPEVNLIADYFGVNPVDMLGFYDENGVLCV